LRFRGVSVSIGKLCWSLFWRTSHCCGLVCSYLGWLLASLAFASGCSFGSVSIQASVFSVDSLFRSATLVYLMQLLLVLLSLELVVLLLQSCTLARARWQEHVGKSTSFFCNFYPVPGTDSSKIVSKMKASWTPEQKEGSNTIGINILPLCSSSCLAELAQRCPRFAKVLGKIAMASSKVDEKERHATVHYR